MTRLAVLAATAALAACATSSTGEGQSAGMCDAAKVQSAVGKSYTAELGAQVRQASGARSLREIRPGQAVTMDYRPDRLNVEMDAGNVIIRISCG